MSELNEPTNDEPNADSAIGVRIRKAREAKGMSQADLSEALSTRRLQLPPQTIYKIERGTRRVLAAELPAIADALGTEPHRLLGVTGEANDRTPIASAGARLEEALRNLHSASVAYARAMLSYAQTIDVAQSVHPNDLTYARESLPRQTPAWLAATASDSLEASLKANRVKITSGSAREVLDALRADLDYYHPNYNG